MKIHKSLRELSFEKGTKEYNLETRKRFTAGRKKMVFRFLFQKIWNYR